jgi:hypothetical protein
VEIGGSGKCLLARVDRLSGKPTCVDSTLNSVAWTDANGTSQNDAVQFDNAGAIYYAGWTNDAHMVLRKVANGVTTDLINDAIWVRDFVVAGDGSVFLKGSTTVTGTSWFRRITPQGGLQTITGENGNLLYKFPDGNIYFGQTVGGTHGVRRYLPSTGQMDPTFWIAASSESTPPTTYRDIGPFCTGPDAAAIATFCSSAGASVGKLITTENGTVYGLADHVMQYFPTLAQPSIGVGSITAMSAANQSDLVIAGLTGGVNVLTRYDAETDTETELLGAANETEIYRLHYVPAAHTVMFDGLRFADNTYIVGRVNLDTLQVTAAPTGSSRLVDFQTF